MHSKGHEHSLAPAIERDFGAVLRLIQLCDAHLDREEAHLETTREALREIYTAAVAGRPQELADVVQRREDTARGTAEMRGERQGFRTEAGAMLSIPAESVTLRTLAGHMPAALGQRLLQRRQKLLDLAHAVDHQARDIALLSHYFLEFLQRFFIELTGGRKSGRYGPEGLRREPICGSLLQAQG
jgi:hypothetical protein